MATWRGDRPSAAAGSRLPGLPAPGDVLVASVGLRGDIFDQTVVLVIDVEDGGALGVVLNRPSTAAVDDLLPGWGAHVCEPDVLHIGGPVARDGALCLAQVAVSGHNPAGWSRCFDDVGLLQLDTPLELVEGHYAGLRVFGGYTGWAPGQLVEELADGSWHVLPGERTDLFTPEPEHLWRRVLRRAPGDLAHHATWTPHPELN